MFAFCMDRTNTAVSHFDQLKTDKGYAAILVNNTEKMASSHQIKHFFIKLSVVTNLIFNKILHQLFLRSLKIEQPKIVFLGIDTMVLDNDDAKKRE